MPRFVRFNTSCRVAGKPVHQGDEKMIDEATYDRLILMIRRNKPYVTLLDMPEAVEKTAPRKKKSKKVADKKKRTKETTVKT